MVPLTQLFHWTKRTDRRGGGTHAPLLFPYRRGGGAYAPLLIPYRRGGGTHAPLLIPYRREGGTHAPLLFPYSCLLFGAFFTPYNYTKVLLMSKENTIYVSCPCKWDTQIFSDTGQYQGIVLQMALRLSNIWSIESLDQRWIKLTQRGWHLLSSSWNQLGIRQFRLIVLIWPYFMKTLRIIIKPIPLCYNSMDQIWNIYEAIWSTSIVWFIIQ